MQTGDNFFIDPSMGEAVRRDLETGAVASLVSIEHYLKRRNKIVDYTNEVLLATFESGRMGVFKPDEKNEAWDDGSAEAEVAAYKASNLLGFHCVPPTLMRTIDGRRGSLQLLLESEFDSCDTAQFQACILDTDPDSLATLQIFDFVFGQWDRRLSNILFLTRGGKTYVSGIDNTKIISRQQTQYGQRPFVSVLAHPSLSGTDDTAAFPFHRAETLVVGDADDFRRRFGEEVGTQLANIYRQCAGMRVRHIVWNGHFWQQPFAFDADERRSIKPFSAHLPNAIRRSLERLDRAMLDVVFSHARHRKFVNAAYFDSILGRRDQVLRHFDHASGATRAPHRRTNADVAISASAISAAT
jgi:hypothetical protein